MKKMMPQANGMAIVSETDFKVLLEQKKIEKCEFCRQKSKRFSAIAIKKGKYIAACPSTDCYQDLVATLAE